MYSLFLLVLAAGCLLAVPRPGQAWNDVGHMTVAKLAWNELSAKERRMEVVGGSLNGHPYEVDAEFLNVPPVGCSTIIPNLKCARASYFRAANVLVNKDIFASHILS